jgi:hypothetical protein
MSPIGTCSAITTYAARIAARIAFAPLGVSATADEVRGLVKSGVVASLSVGFDPLDGEPLDPRRPRGGHRFTRWQLLEASFVSVPADIGAIVTARSVRSMISADARRKLGEALDAHRTAGSLYRDCLRAHQRCVRVVQGLAAADGVPKGTAAAYAETLDRYDRALRLHLRAADEHERAGEMLRGILDDNGGDIGSDTKLIQTSSGTGQSSGSDGGRAAPCRPVWDGENVVAFAHQMRNHIVADALARSAAYRPGSPSLSYAERQRELQALAPRS